VPLAMVTESNYSPLSDGFKPPRRRFTLAVKLGHYVNDVLAVLTS